MTDDTYCCDGNCKFLNMMNRLSSIKRPLLFAYNTVSELKFHDWMHCIWTEWREQSQISKTEFLPMVGNIQHFEPEARKQFNKQLFQLVYDSFEESAAKLDVKGREKTFLTRYMDWKTGDEICFIRLSKTLAEECKASFWIQKYTLPYGDLLKNILTKDNRWPVEFDDASISVMSCHRYEVQEMDALAVKELYFKFSKAGVPEQYKESKSFEFAFVQQLLEASCLLLNKQTKNQTEAQKTQQ